MQNARSAYPKDLAALLQTLDSARHNDIELVLAAYSRAEAAHVDQKRKSGEPYFTHCVAVASILTDFLPKDAEAIAVGLLHDTVEDTDITVDDLRVEFGETVAKLVDGLTKLKNLPIKNVRSPGASRRSSKVNREMEYIRKMLLAMDNDVRVVLVKLADRLHNMRTLGYLPRRKQISIAQETMDIFAPLANWLGIWQIKWELEDLAFRNLNPKAYRSIANALDERRDEREAYVNRIREKLVRAFKHSKISNVSITARPKHIYSIYIKMTNKDLPLTQIYDVRGVRVLVDTHDDCYRALGIVHNLWRPIPSEFDDYIANPKNNFYRSLHTAVHDDAGKTVEVQIRTRAMHKDAEYGIAAHWRYKEGNQRKDSDLEQRLAYLRSSLEFDAEVDDASQFVDTVKSEVFQDRVYCLTPKGQIIELPVGATPIDFAYKIHTDIGDRCRGAKINGRLLPLNYKLHMGDQVEILTVKRGGPSMDWLNPDLDYAVTSSARSKIRRWLRKQNREKHIAMGREALERELKRLGVLDKISFESVARLLSYDKLDDFLARIGSGDITGSQITNRVLEDERKKAAQTIAEEELLKPRAKTSHSNVAKGVSVMGTGGLLVTLARCCSPMPGDEIVGYITRGRGVTAHRADCPNIAGLQDIERLIDVSWGTEEEEEQFYVVPVEISASNGVGLLHEITGYIKDQNVDIDSGIKIDILQDIATIKLNLKIASSQQLSRILSLLEIHPSVHEARRHISG